MHIRVFHSCLETNRQQVAQLCFWAEAVRALTRMSERGRAVIHFLLRLPPDGLEVPHKIDMRQSRDILTF